MRHHREIIKLTLKYFDETIKMLRDRVAQLVTNVSGCRYVSDYRSSGCEVDPGLIQCTILSWRLIMSHSPPSADLRRVVVACALVNCLVKLAREKSVVK